MGKLTKVSGSQVYAFLDPPHGYWQCPLEDSSEALPDVFPIIQGTLTNATSPQHNNIDPITSSTVT